MIKVSNLIEQIFATAVALDQSGGLRNTIFAKDDHILIMNYDHTVLVHFQLRKSENSFTLPIAFKANDYDSDMFEQKDNSIIFHSENEEFLRKKTCGISEITPDEVLKLYENYSKRENEDNWVRVTISNKILQLLDDNLSHTEFSGEKGGNFKALQRNIYSGGIIEIEPKVQGMFSVSLPASFGPIGIKTEDLRALFNFQSSLNFYFPVHEQADYIIVESTDKNKRDMTAIISGCLYDEIIEIKINQKEKEKK